VVSVVPSSPEYAVKKSVCSQRNVSLYTIVSRPHKYLPTREVGDVDKSASQERDKATYVIFMHAPSIVARLPQTKIQVAPGVGE